MDFDFSDEQNMLRDTVRRYVEQEYGFEARERIRRTPAGMDAAVWQGFADLGLLALNVPEEYDGMGGGPVETMLVMGALGEGLVLEPYLQAAVLGARTLAALGNAGQRQAWLPQVAAGSALPILAHDEAATRYDRMAIATTARADGDGYVLQGGKQVIAHAGAAHPLLVSARLEDKLAVFLVPRDAPGLQLTTYRTVDGVPAADLRLDDLRLPRSALLDGAPDAEAALDGVLDIGLAALCGEAIGVLDKLVAATAEYVKERKQFGQPIGKFQALQHRLADMLMHLEQARSMAYLAAVRCVDADAERRRKSLAAAKVVIGQACRFIGQQAVQLHGGMGVTDELIVSHYFKRAMAIEMQAGCTDVHLEAYAAALAA